MSMVKNLLNQMRPLDERWISSLGKSQEDIDNFKFLIAELESIQLDGKLKILQIHEDRVQIMKTI
jgi:hypothetical protein